MEFVSAGLEGLSSVQKDNLTAAQKIVDPVLRWVEISKSVLSPAVPWESHKEIYDSNYAGSAVAPTWVPSASSRKTNIEKVMEKHNIKDFNSFYAWSAAEPEAFWNSALEELAVPFVKPYSKVFNIGKDVTEISYLKDAELNVASSCFSKRKGSDVALIFASETCPGLQTMTFDELNALSNQVANALLRSSETGGQGLKFGDAVGICMPMSPQAVASYIGIVKAGCAVVSIADSFSSEEIARRMELADAKAIITQDVVFRSSPAGVKKLPLYARILAANMTSKVIVVPAAAESPNKDLHDNVDADVAKAMRPATDLTWLTFLKDSSTEFTPVVCSSDHICNILFSSGTTGDPKVIPWTHSTPLKCAVDGFMHQDVQVGDVIAWPTNLGWMMGPWLLFAGFVNGATIALYGGVTSTHSFCKFVEEAKIDMLGVVPSLVKSWKSSNATEGCDWSRITRFSSSGEASDAVAMQWLMSRANYAPVIEYCGGTEIAGSFLSSTMVQPNVPSMFSTPVLGNNFTIINIVDDESGASTAQEVDLGEIAVIPPSLGLSTRLLNRDHNDCYFKGMPKGPRGEVLRRHGDEIQRVHWKGGSAYNLNSKSGDAADDSSYYRALGRCDDTMNLGGIKVSSAEIERVCNCVPGVHETAAIAINPKNGGPSLLVIFALIAPSLKGENLEAAFEELKITAVPTAESLHKSFTNAIKAHLNPLFHVYKIEIVEQMPRTSSNKVMRRTLRDDYYKANNQTFN